MYLFIAINNKGLLEI